MLRGLRRWHQKSKQFETVAFELRSLEMLKAQATAPAPHSRLLTGWSRCAKQMPRTPDWINSGEWCIDGAGGGADGTVAGPTSSWSYRRKLISSRSRIGAQLQKCCSWRGRCRWARWT